MQAETNGKPDIDSLSFEDALGRLEETARALESGGLSLEQATQLYEDGVKLARVCNEILTSAELRISRIRTSYGEQMGMREESGVYFPDDEEDAGYDINL